MSVPTSGAPTSRPANWLPAEPPLAAEEGIPAAVPPQGAGAPPVAMASDYVELQRPAAEARNPQMESRAEAQAQKEQFMGGLKKGRAQTAQGPRMGPAEGSQPPGLGQQISEALGKLGQDGAGLAGELGGLSPLALGGLFAQAPPEQMAEWLNGLGTASETDKRELLPKLLEGLERAQPPARLSQEVLEQLEGETLRALAAHTGGEAGAKGLARSGLLGELAKGAEGHSGNAMAALEGISRLGAKELPGALKAAGLDEQKLVQWVKAAGETHPMESKGGWVNPETVVRLAGKLAEQPGGAGLGSAVALTSAALAERAEKGLTVDEGLQKGLETVLKKAQGDDVPPTRKAEAAKALIDSGLFRHPGALSPELREQSTALVASAGQELTKLYVGNARDRDIDPEETRKLSGMVQALGFTGPEEARRNFNSMWGSLIGATMKSAVDQKNKRRAGEAGMLLKAYSQGAAAAEATHDAKAKALGDLLSFAVSGIGGGFSWRMGAYNLVSPLKEGGKGLASDLAKQFLGDGPDAVRLAEQLQTTLLKDAGRYADRRGLDDQQWDDLKSAFKVGKSA